MSDLTTLDCFNLRLTPGDLDSHRHLRRQDATCKEKKKSSELTE